MVVITGLVGFEMGRSSPFKGANEKNFAFLVVRMLQR